MNKFTASPEQIERNHRGAALCRAQLVPPQRADEPAPRDESERIHQAALERARGERRDRRTDPTAAGASFGEAVRQIRSSR